MSLAEKLPYYHPFAQGFPGIGSQRVPVDSDVLSFASASGAIQVVDLVKLENLVAYLKSQSLWDYARFYPMKSAQNAGSGSTVYGLGGLTSNNMTLVNSPTWGSNGVTFASASSHYGKISDFLSTTTGDLSMFARLAHSSPSTSLAESMLAQWDTSGNHSFLYMFRGDVAGNPYRIVRSRDGTSQEAYDDDGGDDTTDERTLVIQSLGASRKLFVNKAEKALSPVSGFTPQTGLLNSSVDITLGAAGGSGPGTLNANFAFTGFIETTLTTAQRETITDLINAL